MGDSSTVLDLSIEQTLIAKAAEGRLSAHLLSFMCPSLYLFIHFLSKWEHLLLNEH